MKILVIQLRRIGDVIVTLPVVSALRAQFPQARIDFLVEPAAAPVVRGFPGVDDALVFEKRHFWRWAWDIRRRGYDWVLDFMNNPRTAQIALLSGAPVRAGFEAPLWGRVYTHRLPRPSVPQYAVQSKFDLLRALGLTPSVPALPEIRVTEEDFSPVGGWWKEKSMDAYAERVAVMPAHRRPIRRWPAHKFSELIRLLNGKKDRAVILFGGPGEEGYIAGLRAPFSERVFAAPVAGLRQAAALLSRCHVAVTNCSGLMHLAVAVGTPTLTVYGPTWPESWNPRVRPHRYVQTSGLRCIGCNRDECPYAHECLEWISAERVCGETESMLKERRAVPAGGR
ncbi:MAG TPA: glycosyltransferase family 9 protein [Elusimicrobiota bacterium]|nr:glycosyltransferase family 9 protein [Elusimicrobiota bacterium]